MKHSIILLVFFITASIAHSQPKISVDNLDVNLGTIFSGMKKKGTFTIKNIGTDTLRVISIQPSCGCTAVKQPKQILLPNESDAIEIELNTAGFRGRVEKHINIVSNDPASQYLSVRLIAEIKEELTPLLGSTLVWFGSLKKGETAERTFSVINASDNKIKIKNYSASNPSINATLDKKNLNPKDTLNIKIKVKAEKPNYNSESIVLSTDSKNQPTMEVRISFLVTSE